MTSYWWFENLSNLVLSSGWKLSHWKDISTTTKIRAHPWSQLWQSTKLIIWAENIGGKISSYIMESVGFTWKSILKSFSQYFFFCGKISFRYFLSSYLFCEKKISFHSFYQARLNKWGIFSTAVCRLNLSHTQQFSFFTEPRKLSK